MNKFVVVVFPDAGQADKAVAEIRSLHADGVLSLYGVIVANKNDAGHVELVEKVGKGVPGAAVGALAGGIIGLLAGPLTAALTAAGGAWLGTWRDMTHLGVGTDFLEDVTNALADGTAAVIADVGEDRVAPLDEAMEGLGGVVLREWQAELPEMNLATEAAARKTEVEHLRAEREETDGRRRELVEQRLERAKERLKQVGRRAETQLDALEQSSAQRLETLQRQADAAAVNLRANIERRIAETKENRAKREALLKKTIALAGTVH